MNLGCIICVERFTATSDIFAVPCGHLFHHGCLLQWLERVPNCPHCRKRVREKDLVKIFHSDSTFDGDDVDVGALENKVQSLNFKLDLAKVKANQLLEENKSCQSIISQLQNEVKVLMEEVKTKNNTVGILKTQLVSLNKVEKEAEQYKKKLVAYQSMEVILGGTAEEANETLANKDVSAESLTLFCSMLKKELVSQKSRNTALQEEMSRHRARATKYFKNAQQNEHKVKTLQVANAKLEEKFQEVENEREILKRKIILQEKSSEKTSADSQMSLNSSASPVISWPFDIGSQSELKKSRCPPSPNEVIVIEDSPKAESVPKKQKKLLSLSSTLNKPGHSAKRSPLQELTDEMHKYSIFKKPHLRPSEWRAHVPNDPEVGYDGFGGHSKADIFPNPKKQMPRFIKARKVPRGIATNGKYVQKTTLFDFALSKDSE